MKTLSKLLVRARDIKPTLPNFRVRGALNPGAVRLPNGKIELFARIAETPKHGEKYFLAPRFEGTKKTRIVIEKIPRQMGKISPDYFLMNEHIYRLPTISHIRKILLDKSGMNVQRISQKPDFLGRTEDGDFGVEDPRITEFAGEGRYGMTYVSVSMSSGVSTSLAISKDLINWQRKGIIFRQQNKDVVIYPEKIDGYYVAMHRPEGTMIFDKPSIWLSYSKDLTFWGKDKPIMQPRENSWDSLRIGSGTVPLRLDEGWLVIYHGVKLQDPDDDESKKVYSAGAALFDIKNPARLLAMSPKNEPLLEPEHDFERNGFVNNVVFPTAAIPDKDGRNLLVYCGASDSNIEVRRLKISSILSSLV
ncbi:MAG TPA: hypothetical protein VJH23_06635 [archaeon]|nr:hypothetical protein [archaeon]